MNFIRYNLLKKFYKIFEATLVYWSSWGIYNVFDRYNEFIVNFIGRKLYDGLFFGWMWQGVMIIISLYTVFFFFFFTLISLIFFFPSK